MTPDNIQMRSSLPPRSTSQQSDPVTNQWRKPDAAQQPIVVKTPSLHGLHQMVIIFTDAFNEIAVYIHITCTVMTNIIVRYDDYEDNYRHIFQDLPRIILAIRPEVWKFFFFGLSYVKGPIKTPGDTDLLILLWMSHTWQCSNWPVHTWTWTFYVFEPRTVQGSALKWRWQKKENKQTKKKHSSIGKGDFIQALDEGNHFCQLLLQDVRFDDNNKKKIVRAVRWIVAYSCSCNISLQQRSKVGNYRGKLDYREWQDISQLHLLKWNWKRQPTWDQIHYQEPDRLLKTNWIEQIVPLVCANSLWLPQTPWYTSRCLKHTS